MWVIEDSDAELEKGDIFSLAKKHKVTETIFNRLLREAEIPELARQCLRTTRAAGSLCYESCCTREQRDSESHMKHKHGQNNQLTTRSRNTGTHMGEGE